MTRQRTFGHQFAVWKLPLLAPVLKVPSAAVVFLPRPNIAIGPKLNDRFLDIFGQLKLRGQRWGR